MCIRDRGTPVTFVRNQPGLLDNVYAGLDTVLRQHPDAIMTLVASGDIPLLTSDMVEWFVAVSYTHLRAHETVLDLVCRLLLEKKKQRVLDILYVSDMLKRGSTLLCSSTNS